MFAVIKTGGKQYRVSEEQKLLVEKLEGDAGAQVKLDQVLMLGEDGAEPTVGAPLVDKAAVYAEVVRQTRGDKIVVFKKKRRQNYRRKAGHQQDLTLIKVTKIAKDGKAPAKKKAAAKKAAPKKEAEAPAKAETEAAADSAE